MGYYAGIDVLQKESSVCVVDAVPSRIFCYVRYLVACLNLAGTQAVNTILKVTGTGNMIAFRQDAQAKRCDRQERT